MTHTQNCEKSTSGNSFVDPSIYRPHTDGQHIGQVALWLLAFALRGDVMMQAIIGDTLASADVTAGIAVRI